MVIQHKCNNCGADMIFNAETGMLYCESCGTNIDISQMNMEQQTQNTFNEFVSTASESTYGNDEATQYQCKNCGAVLITDNDTSATTCSFCGAAMILGDRLTGELAPTKVIPFTISKEQAQEAFKKWCKKGLLTPKGFMSANRIKSITGMYVPFWLFDLEGDGEYFSNCTKVRSYTQGDYRITETKHYDVYRHVNLHYNKIPVDASEKMDDLLMDKLEPFDYNNLQTFQTPYLSGYIAEKYNFTDEQLYPRVKQRTEEYMKDYVRDTMREYSSNTFVRQSVDIRPKNTYYTLLPVWMLCYNYEKNDYTFAMNGQTGKIVGKPPISKGKVFTLWGILGILLFVIVKVIAYLIGGVWL